jgi:hypothetical protein
LAKPHAGSELTGELEGYRSLKQKDTVSFIALTTLEQLSKYISSVLGAMFAILFGLCSSTSDNNTIVVQQITLLGFDFSDLTMFLSDNGLRFLFLRILRISHSCAETFGVARISWHEQTSGNSLILTDLPWRAIYRRDDKELWPRRRS